MYVPITIFLSIFTQPSALEKDKKYGQRLISPLHVVSGSELHDYGLDSAVKRIAQTNRRTSNCLETSIRDRHTNQPLLVLRNLCDVTIMWKMCVYQSDKPFKEYPSGRTAPRGTSTYRLRVGDNASYKFTANYAWGNQTASAPNC